MNHFSLFSLFFALSCLQPVTPPKLLTKLFRERHPAVSLVEWLAVTAGCFALLTPKPELLSGTENMVWVFLLVGIPLGIWLIRNSVTEAMTGAPTGQLKIHWLGGALPVWSL